MYSIIGIDGIDGSGKSTVTQFVKERLIMMGYKVITIEPPFYDTVSGSLVTDYLRNGYGDIRDRYIASMYYSFDRNMWMRDHFTETFIDPDNWMRYRNDSNLIILYTRNWLSNIFFQTTPIAQSAQDDIKVMGHYYTMIENDEGTTIGLSLPVMYDILQEIKINGGRSDRYKISNFRTIRRIQTLYRVARAYMVRSMIMDVYTMEIRPWHAYLPKEVSEARGTDPMMEFDIIDAADSVCNIVLAPHIAKNSVDILRNNLMKRYNGDDTKMDRNEANREYMASVLENIHWINKHFGRILGKERLFNQNLPFNRYLVDSNEFTQNGALPGCGNLEPVLEKGFQYYILHTTDKETGEQLNIDRILDTIMGMLQLHIKDFGIKK